MRFPTDLGATFALGSFELATRLGGVPLFSVIATLGAPIEITSADLAIETFLPADPESPAPATPRQGETEVVNLTDSPIHLLTLSMVRW